MTDDDFIRKYDKRLKPVINKDEQYEKDRQTVIQQRTPATTVDPLFPNKSSYVFMTQLGKWQIMFNGNSLPEFYSNRKEATNELKILTTNHSLDCST